MEKMKERIKGLSIAALCMAIFVPATAAALPGQTKSAVCAWAHRSSALAEVQCDSGSEGDIAYVSGKIHKPYGTDRLFFESHPDQSGKIVFEKIAYTHSPRVSGVDFDQKSSNGLKLLRAFYGRVADDFSAAAHVAEIKKHHIYRGKRFIYLVVSQVYKDDAQADQQKIIENDFLLFRHSALTAAENYARRNSAGI